MRPTVLRMLNLARAQKVVIPAEAVSNVRP